MKFLYMNEFILYCLSFCIEVGYTQDNHQVIAGQHSETNIYIGPTGELLNLNGAILQPEL